jgi:hypothetical protein
MGVPDWVDTDHHHTPKDIVALATRHPEIHFVITHTFVDDDVAGAEVMSVRLPNMPKNVHLAKDGEGWSWNGRAWVFG